MTDSEIATFPNKTEHLLDARGLSCPLPILKARKALSGLASGELLKVMATDPGSVADIAAFCNQTGNTLVGSGGAAGAFEFLIRKA